MAQGIGGRDQKPLLGQGSQQNPIMAFSDIHIPLVVTGPTLEVPLGFFGPRDGENIQWGAVACLAETPVAAKAFVTCTAGSRRDTVLVSVFTSALAAAAGATQTKINLIATRGSAVAQ